MSTMQSAPIAAQIPYADPFHLQDQQFSAKQNKPLTPFSPAAVDAMYAAQAPIEQEVNDMLRQGLGVNQVYQSTPIQPRPAKTTDYGDWRESVGRSPLSVASTPSMMDSASSMNSSGLHTPTIANTPISPLISQFGMVSQSGRENLSLRGSPTSASQQLNTFANGQYQLPGVLQAASNEGDSLNLNNIGGDGGPGEGGYDQGGYGGDGHGGYGGDDHYGDHGNGGYGPPGENGGGGSGGDGNDPGEGPPPPPKGKKLQLACHFCRRRKLKCDGVRPVCANCHKRGEECLFDGSVRRRGPGKRTKDMRQRSGHSMHNNDGSFGAFVLNDSQHNPLGGPSHDPSHASTPDLGQMAAAASASQHQQHAVYHDPSMPSANLADMDPNIDPALAILGMGMDPEPSSSHSPIPPATLAEADPVRGQKRKSDLVGEDDGKRLKLEDETYEGTLPSGTDLGGEVGVGVGVGVGVVDVGDIPGFAGWNPDTLTGEGREGEVDEADLAKFENDLRRVIQDQADAEAQASGQV